jgi:hypothetical protein
MLNESAIAAKAAALGLQCMVDFGIAQALYQRAR